MSVRAKKRRPKGDGSVQQLSKDRFKAQITVGYDSQGRQRRKSFTAKTQREAVAMLSAFKAEQQKGTLAAPCARTLQQFATRWLQIKKACTKEKTYASYELACSNHILPALGRLRLSKLTTADINDYIGSKLRQGLSAATLSQHRAILHNMLALAVAEGCVGRNAVAAASPIRKTPKEQSILTEAEMSRLLKIARDYRPEGKKGFRQIYHILLLALATGLRRGEILGLRWENIDMANSSLTVAESIVEISGRQVRSSPKTAGSRRTIAVDPTVLKLLRDELWTPAGGPVFTGGNRQAVAFSTLGRAFRAVLALAGITRQVRLHDLRHTHVTHLLANGYDLKLVAARIGDDVRTAIEVYAHALPEKDRSAASFIAAKLLH